jgi:hypothetical protein
MPLEGEATEQFGKEALTWMPDGEGAGATVSLKPREVRVYRA